MRVNLIVLFCFLIIFSGSCRNDSLREHQEARDKRALEILEKEVMELHDKVMPKSVQLPGLKSKLLKLTEGLTDSVNVMEIYAVADELENAYKEMMDWMHDYHAPSDSIEREQRFEYYTEQKRLMSQISDQTDKVILEANAIIEKYKN